MTGTRVYISGMGIISSLGSGNLKTKDALQKGLKGIRPLKLFTIASGRPLPVGEVPGLPETDSVPRTHQLARLAAGQAMSRCTQAPDAVVMGVTTGGMSATEALLKIKASDPELFRYHGIGSVAEDIAAEYCCKGPVITVSTACSSGTVAIKFALELLRSGMAKRVLAGGADCLCRLTYYGFKSLQLIDPEGARPLDKNRRGMSVAEGAAMMLLTVDQADNAIGEILGAGLSCDAYHPTRPHPRGKGALAAMQSAIKHAQISPADIDYINLHGTGTPDNDHSEAEAINAIFPLKKPHLSSVKGAFGHSLAASGAIEAVVAALSISNHMVPANTGCRLPDPDLNLNPELKPLSTPVNCVLSNSFGFGGNNAAVILAKPGKFNYRSSSTQIKPLAVLGYACMTGAGNTAKTVANIIQGKSCKGLLSVEEISENLSPRIVRRLKRLPRMALSLALAAHQNSERTAAPAAVFLGTGWGAQSETYDFLTGLFESDEQFPSPTDFVGSVHNAPAGQIALQFQSTGPNITTSGGDYSFEQALLAAHLLAGDIPDSFFLVGADESHAVLSRLFDRSVLAADILSDGGGAFCLKGSDSAAALSIALKFFENSANNPDVIPALIRQLGGPEQINAAYGALWAGMPAGCRSESEKQLQVFLLSTGFENPVIDFRKTTGEFAAASAVAAAMAAQFITDDQLPGPICSGRARQLNGKGALILGLGKLITAMEIIRP
ncbi:MAG: beta-ketoacyl-[acyl-carrier-protein] synthase family protein [Desulfobacterales bacterium]|nr:beta-ketoacyl-[acyl-carrier-protein] synthase family protein [Desulfobacterales bacterium]